MIIFPVKRTQSHFDICDATDRLITTNEINALGKMLDNTVAMHRIAVEQRDALKTAIRNYLAKTDHEYGACELELLELLK